MRLAGVTINDDDSAVLLLKTVEGNCTSTIAIGLDAVTFSAWLDSAGDGVAPYREDLLALALAHRG